MFEVFGNMDSAEEINKTAEGLKNEGDKDSLYKLAEENGIDKGFAEMYLAGIAPFLCDVATAAVGKLILEANELKAKELIADWIEYIKVSCMEDEELARAVRCKNKSMKECLAELMKWSYKNMYEIPKDVAKAAGINANVKFGIPGMRQAKNIIRKYYLGK